MKQKKVRRPIIRTVLCSMLSVVMVVAMVAANTLIPPNENMVNAMLGDTGAVQIKQPDTYNDSLDLQYNKPEFTAEELVVQEQALNEEIVGEGVVLLKNDGNAMPYAADTNFSFFGRSSTKIMGNNYYDIMVQMGYPADPGTTLKSTFLAEGFGVNETLWDFYDSGNGSSYGLGVGSIDYGDAEDFSINECPIDVLQSESGLLESCEGTVPVFVWTRKVGEGRDMPRSMYNHTSIAEDQTKSYLEPDSVELAILSYLNENYDDVVLLVNSSAAMELGWVEQFESIHSILYVPSVGNYGLNSVAGIFSGRINPSGHTVDTFAADAFSAPAAANYGDFQYYSEDGTPTKYNYISYKEGIYVGYKYYETRYEDVVLGQGNAGEYDYAAEVVYPFGYGLSYTTFDWSNYKVHWDGDVCNVTVVVKNTGDRAGKDVVQIYAQSPYTEYDIANKVEKASVQLVGFGKTSLLEPGQSETVTITFDRELLAAYDYTNAKTYILDAGDYYIAAGTDAHTALNNILAVKGKTVADGMTSEGNADLVDVYTVDTLDATTYANDSTTGTAVTNQFDFVNGELDYLSRSDWQGTWPTTDGELSDQISTWGNEINGEDGKPYTYKKTISGGDLAALDSTDSLNPTDPSTITDTPAYGAGNEIELISLRGKAYDDPDWQQLLDNLNPEDYQTIITASGYGSAELASVGKPSALDQDGSTGLVGGGGSRTAYAGTLVLAGTWNQPLATRYGEMIGNNALLGSCAGWYAPAMNIHRLPFSGRNNEYYSEDGLLTGVIAAATSRGAASKGMYTFIKHFALNDQENHRGDRTGQFGLATWANEQAIRELYLLPFKLCIENDPVTLNYVEEDGNGGYVNASREYPAVGAVMTSFNRLGYTWAGGCYNLITGVLRNEWGFNGFVLTDNANTGLFMDAYQMIEAGGDAELTTSEYVRWTYDKDDAASYHYGREAMHHVLYTVVNSKTMSGLMPGSEVVASKTLAEKLVIGINIVAIVVIALMVLIVVLGWRKYKKRKAAAQ